MFPRGIRDRSRRAFWGDDLPETRPSSPIRLAIAILIGIPSLTVITAVTIGVFLASDLAVDLLGLVLISSLLSIPITLITLILYAFVSRR